MKVETLKAGAIRGAAAAALLVLAAPGARAQVFFALDLGVAPGFGESSASDVNNRGEVTGTLTTAGHDPIAFIWLPAPAYGLPAGMTALGTLPSGGLGFSFGAGINDCGQVIGTSSTTQATRGFVWENGQMMDLGALTGSPGSFSGATDINERGAIVGYSDSSTSPPFATHPFLTCKACSLPLFCGMHDLGSLGGYWSAAHGINESRQVAGESFLATPPGVYIVHATFWSATTGLVDLGALPGSSASVALALNNDPIVVGWSGVDDPSGYRERVVRWKRTGSGWQIQDLGTFAGHTYNIPTATNDEGWIVGYSYTPGGPSVPFLWAGNTFQDLNPLVIHSGTQPILIEQALGLNEKGDIAAYGFNGQGQPRAFLLLRL